MAAEDPVCGMTGDEHAEAPMSEYNGRIVFFCSESCKRALDADPSA
jgi:YHS domain-containing protein